MTRRGNQTCRQANIVAMNTFRTIGTASMFMATLIAAPAAARADCGDAGQDPCAGTMPTVDEVVGIMQQLADPNVPAANKDNIVTPGFSPDEAGTIDDHLNRMRRQLPPDFVVTNIQPSPDNLAGATVETRHTYARPIVLVNQGGHWLITHDTAMTELDVFWRAANRRGFVDGFVI
jgi:hypothetical protein